MCDEEGEESGHMISILVVVHAVMFTKQVGGNVNVHDTTCNYNIQTGQLRMFKVSNT